MLDNNNIYTAHFDAGYHENIEKYSLSFIIMKDNKITDVLTDIVASKYSREQKFYNSTMAETLALKHLLVYIDKKYKGEKFIIYGDYKGLIENINHGYVKEEHSRIGEVVDSFRHLYNKESMKIEWKSRCGLLLVDYLNKYIVKGYNFNGFDDLRVIKLTKDFRNYFTIEGTTLYELISVKENGLETFQTMLIKTKTGKFILSVRNKGKNSDYHFITRTEELNKIIKGLCKDCKKIIFNNKNIGTSSILVEHINNMLLGEVG